MEEAYRDATDWRNTLMFGITWITLTAVFFYFSFVYWRYSTSPMRSFIFRNIEETQPVEGSESELSQLSDEFRGDLEGFLDSINKTNKVRYRVAAAGFLIAGINALANLFLF